MRWGTAQQWIRTLPRRGYLFDADPDAKLPATPPTSAATAVQEPPARRSWRRPAYALAVTAALATGTVLTGLWTRPAHGPGPGIDAELAQRRSIAVMPFTDHSEPEAPHIAHAVDDRLSSELGRLADTKVVAPESSAMLGTSKTVDFRRAGRELGVRHLVTGSTRLEGGRLAVSLRLLRTGDGAVLWSGRFDYPSVAEWATQSDILAHVANALDTRVGQAMLTQAARAPVGANAIDHWLRGRYILASLANPEQLAAARWHFAAALTAQPRSAHALTGLAFTHLVEVIQRWSQDPKSSLATAKSLARQALAVDPDSQAALNALAGAQMFAGELADALSTTERALALNPNDAHANRDLAANHFFQGRWNDALRQLGVAARLNPLDTAHMARVNGMAAVALVALRRYDEAIEHARRGQVLQPGSAGPLTLLAAAEAHRGDPAAARAAAAEVMRRDPGYFIGKGASARGSTAPAYLHGIEHVNAGQRLAGLPEARVAAVAERR